MQGKKSFLLYIDLIHTIERMPDDKAGALLKHILRYVNDLNPETDDLITQIAFEPIKQQLKRDLIEWKDTCEKNKNNGRLGGRPKKTETQNNPPVIKETERFFQKPKKADSDKGTDTDTDTVKDKEREVKGKTIESDAWIEQTCIAYRIEKNDSHTLKEFCEDWIRKKIVAKKFDNYHANALIGFMLKDFELKKEKSVAPKKEKYDYTEFQNKKR